VVCSHRCRGRRLLTLVLLCWAASSQAQQRLTAEQAVALAAAQRHVQDESEAGIAVARSRVQDARVWANPTLGVERETLRDGPGQPASETSVVLSQPLALGGRRGARIRAAQAGVAAAEAEAVHERTRLRGEVLREYYAVVAAERRMHAQAKMAAGLGSLADIAGKRQRAGDLSGYESRRIAQASAQAQARHLQAQANARAARTRLAGWIGEAALLAQLDETLALPASPGDADGSAELDALNAQRAYAAAQAAAARRLSLPVTVGFGSKRIRQGGASDDALLLEVGVPLPVFDRNQGERARTQAELQRADARYQRTLAQTRARRSAAWEEARQLAASARQMQEGMVPEAARLTAIARNSFAEGELDLVGLLDAYDAEAALIDGTLDLLARALDALLEVERLSPVATAPPTPTP
jgi:cobalt-zinc-cadmium efflux system outer membrane protein